MTSPTTTLTETLSLAGLPLPAPRGLCLVITNGGASWEVPLSVGEMIIGRAPGLDVTIDDPTISRHHAIVRVEAPDVVFIRDAGSRNGTRFAGVPVTEEAPFRPGDIVTVGAATLHLFQGAFHDAGRLTTGAEVRSRLAVEIERAVRGGQPCCIWELRSRSSVLHVAPLFAEALRPGDTVAEIAPKRLVALLPNLTADDGVSLATRVLDALAARGHDARIGAASAPMDGADVTSLFEAASAAAEAAPSRGVHRVPDSLRRIEVGTSSVWVGDPEMARVYAMLERLATGPLPVLITGETGTGKELAARLVHERSPRRAGPFVAVNCGAIAPGTAEAELFGHARGAFTGAVQARAGYFETASGGTIFLDEVGELTAPLQANLLRVLETQTLVRVGEVAPRKIDVRIVAATHRDLEAEIQAGRFREDLFFRIVGAQVELLPLRGRRLEIVPLARAFLRAERPEKTPVLTVEAEAALTAHSWPGNLRELRNAMRYVAGTCVEPTAGPEHLPTRVREGGRGTSGVTELPTSQPRPTMRVTSPELPAFRPIAEEVKNLESQRIREALEAAGGNKTKASQLIGMPIRTFTEKLKQYGLGEKK